VFELRAKKIEPTLASQACFDKHTCGFREREQAADADFGGREGSDVLSGGL
jgi:hypothetical protein